MTGAIARIGLVVAIAVVLSGCGSGGSGTDASGDCCDRSSREGSTTVPSGKAVREFAVVRRLRDTVDRAVLPCKASPHLPDQFSGPGGQAAQLTCVSGGYEVDIAAWRNSAEARKGLAQLHTINCDMGADSFPWVDGGSWALEGWKHGETWPNQALTKRLARAVGGTYRNGVCS